MPTVRVAIWNIQNYGAGDPTRKWAANSDLRNEFIALAVRQLNVQVLFIQEVSVNALGSLQNLATKLNVGGVTDWAVSFCGSAVTSQAQNPPANAGEMSFQTDGRSEGYAVCWRTNLLGTYSVVNGANQIAEVHPPITNAGNPNAPATTPLNLVTTGRPVGRVGVYVQQGGKRKVQADEINAVGGYLRPNLLPYGEDNQLMLAWPQLDFPTTSTMNPEQLTWPKVRRPAFIVLNLNTGGNPDVSLMPVIAYHAPSNRNKAGWGALLSGLSRELYVVDGVDVNNDPDPANSVSMRRTVLGGDFNYAVPDGWFPAEYGYFTKTLARSEKGGAACRYAPPDNVGAARLTTVQLFDTDNQTPITSANLNAYYRYPIDLIFFRGFPANQSTGRRVNIPDILLNNGGPYAAVLNLFDAHLNALVLGLAGPNQRMDPGNTGPQEWVNNAWKPMLCGNYGGTFLNWNTFLNNLNNGQLNNARRTAEFYQIFISDHLPVLSEINF